MFGRLIGEAAAGAVTVTTVWNSKGKMALNTNQKD